MIISHKVTSCGLSPQPKKMKPQITLITLITLINKKIRRKFLLQKYCYESVSSGRPKFSFPKNKKLTESTTKLHKVAQKNKDIKWTSCFQWLY
jgi:hypothetical protein